jgi:uncharacterized protein (DUF885 family)
VIALADEYVARRLARYPEAATLQGVTSADHAALFDNSAAALRVWQRYEDGLWARLERIDGRTLGGRPEW